MTCLRDIDSDLRDGSQAQSLWCLHLEKASHHHPIAQGAHGDLSPRQSKDGAPDGP